MARAVKRWEVTARKRPDVRLPRARRSWKGAANARTPGGLAAGAPGPTGAPARPPAGAGRAMRGGGVGGENPPRAGGLGEDPPDPRGRGPADVRGAPLLAVEGARELDPAVGKRALVDRHDRGVV